MLMTMSWSATGGRNPSPRTFMGVRTRALSPAHATQTYRLRLVGREAIEQPIASRAAQVCLAAAALGATRGMRGIPGSGGLVIAQAFAIDVSHHGGAGAALCPVSAGAILVGRKGPSVRLRAGQYIVVIGREANAGNHGASLGQRSLHAELVICAVKVIDVLRDYFALE